jgi:hypothetical protein
LLLAAAFAAAFLTVPLAGGRLTALADVVFRRMWALGVALGLQVVVVYAWPQGPGELLAALHVASYFAAGWFVVGNGHIPGWWLMGLGGLMNFAAIAANSGVMPASRSAVASAGLDDVAGRFANSAVVAEPKLAWLGDVFAVPSGWPLANVFSVGDVCLVVGGAVALHAMCASRLAAAGAGKFTRLLLDVALVRVWLAHATSSVAQWAVVVAIVAAAAEGSAPPRLAPLVVAAVAGAVVAGLLGGPFVDRVAAGRMMTVLNLARAAAVVSLLPVAEPVLAHGCLVAAGLGAGEVLWQATVGATAPEVVARRRVVAANALLSGASCGAVIAGPALGAAIAAARDRVTLVLVCAVALAASSAFVVGLDRGTESPAAGGQRDLAAGPRRALMSPSVRGPLVVAAVIMLAVARGAPLVADGIATTAQTLGPTAAAWTFGIALGAAAVPAAASRWPLERFLPAGSAALGGAVLGASQATALPSRMGLWVVAGFGAALAAISYVSLLQEATPYALKGRVLGLGAAVGSAALLAGVAVAAWIESLAGASLALAASGVLLFVAAAASVVLVSARTAATARAGATRTATSAP